MSFPCMCPLYLVYYQAESQQETEGTLKGLTPETPTKGTPVKGVGRSCGLNCVPQKKNVEVLTSSTTESDLLGEWGHCN